MTSKFFHYQSKKAGRFRPRCKVCRNKEAQKYRIEKGLSTGTTESVPEREVRWYLEKELKMQNLHDFIQEREYPDLKSYSGSPLRFDFALTKYNIAIEVDGLGHRSPIFGRAAYNKTQIHDGIKNVWCNQKGVTLIRIPDWKFNDIKVFLDINLKPLIKK